MTLDATDHDRIGRALDDLLHNYREITHVSDEENFVWHTLPDNRTLGEKLAAELDAMGYVLVRR